MKSVQKFLLMILIAILTISCMAGCSKNVEEEIRLAMYEVNFDGTRLNQYPKYVFTDRELLEKIHSFYMAREKKTLAPTERLKHLKTKKRALFGAEIGCAQS